MRKMIIAIIVVASLLLAAAAFRPTAPSVAVFGRTVRPCPPHCGYVVVQKRISPSGEGVFASR